MASVASAAANGNGSKKRRKGTDLKPIVTNENMAVDSNSGSTSSQGYSSLFSAMTYYEIAN